MAGAERKVATLIRSGVRRIIFKRQNDELVILGVVIGVNVECEGFICVVSRGKGNIHPRECIILAAALLGMAGSSGFRHNPYGDVIGWRLCDADSHRNRCAARSGLLHPAWRSVRAGCNKEDAQIIVSKSHFMFQVALHPAFWQVSDHAKRKVNVLVPFAGFIIDARQRNRAARLPCANCQASGGNRVIPVCALPACRSACGYVQRDIHVRGVADAHLDIRRFAVLAERGCRAGCKADGVIVRRNCNPMVGAE